MSYLDEHPEMEPLGKSFMEALLSMEHSGGGGGGSVYRTTLLASSWQSLTYTVPCSAVFPDTAEAVYWIDCFPDDSATLAQQQAFWSAEIAIENHEGYMVLTAATVPAVNIPVIFTIERSEVVDA